MRSKTLKNITYWASTGLLALDFVVGGLFQLTRSAEVLQGFAHLGYPRYFVTLLGVWKVLGGVALLVPGLPRLKEWAYAGIFYDVTAAVVSVLAVGDGWGPATLPLVFAVLTLVSWALRPASRTLANPSSVRSAGPGLTPSVETGT